MTTVAIILGATTIGYGIVATLTAWNDRPAVTWSVDHQRWIAARSRHRITP